MYIKRVRFETERKNNKIACNFLIYFTVRRVARAGVDEKEDGVRRKGHDDDKKSLNSPYAT